MNTKINFSKLKEILSSVLLLLSFALPHKLGKYAGTASHIVDLFNVLYGLKITLLNWNNMKKRSSFMFSMLTSKKFRIAQLRNFFDFYYSRIYAFVFELIKNETETEKILIAVFARLGKTHAFFFSVEGIEKFLYRAAWAECLDYITDPEIIRLGNGKFSNLVFGPGEDMISMEIIRAEIIAELHRQLESLPKNDRFIFELSYLQGMEDPEVAKQLNITEKRVAMVRRKVLKTVRSAILKRMIDRAIYR